MKKKTWEFFLKKCFKNILDRKKESKKNTSVLNTSSYLIELKEKKKKI